MIPPALYFYLLAYCIQIADAFKSVPTVGIASHHNPT